MRVICSVVNSGGLILNSFQKWKRTNVMDSWQSHVGIVHDDHECLECSVTNESSKVLWSKHRAAHIIIIMTMSEYLDSWPWHYGVQCTLTPANMHFCGQLSETALCLLRSTLPSFLTLNPQYEYSRSEGKEDRVIIYLQINLDHIQCRPNLSPSTRSPHMRNRDLLLGSLTFM